MAELNERRSQTRIAWRGNLQLVLPGGAPIPASIHDMSPDGLSLWIDQLLPLGSPVEVWGNGFTGDGTVQSCELQGTRYRVGLALSSPNAG
jgi:hypothetical protein